MADTVHLLADSHDAPGQGRGIDVEACRDCYNYRRLQEDVQESLKQEGQTVSARHPKWEQCRGPLFRTMNVFNLPKRL